MVLNSVSCFIINVSDPFFSLRYSISSLRELTYEKFSPVGESVVSASLFYAFISAKNACVRRLNSSTSSFLKDWSSSFILKPSPQLLLFGM